MVAYVALIWSALDKQHLLQDYMSCQDSSELSNAANTLHDFEITGVLFFSHYANFFGYHEVAVLCT